MKAWLIQRHGGLEVLEQKEIPTPEPPRSHVRIKVHTVGLNHLDLWVRNGVPGHRFPLPLIPGCDVTGTIESFGPLEKSEEEFLTQKNLVPGARVVVNAILSCGKCKSCLSGFDPTCPEFGLVGETRDGGCAEYLVVPTRNLVLIPKTVSFEEAAALPIAYVTAWSMLTRKTQTKSGDLVLIQAGGSGVSVAAIQIAKFFNATVITTVGSEEKAAKARALGADHVILYKQSVYRDEFKKIVGTLGRKGVDIALDHVGVDTFSDSLRSLDWGGKLVTCGATSGSKIEVDLKAIFFKNLSIMGSTMGGHSDLEAVLQLIAEKKLKAVIDSQFAFNDLPKAHAHLEARDAFGKILVQL